MQALFTVIEVEGRKTESCAVEQGIGIKKAFYRLGRGQCQLRQPWPGDMSNALTAASPIF